MRFEKVIEEIEKLVPGDPDSFLVADVKRNNIEFIQTKRNEDETYHVEIGVNNGTGMFDGITIYAADGVSMWKAIRYFALMATDSPTLPEGFHELKEKRK